MPRESEHPLDRKLREEQEREEQERIKRMHDARLRDAYRAVASTPEGRMVLAEWVNDYTAALASIQYKGNSQDSYNLGRAYQAEEIRRTLQSVLTREQFLEIIYPKEQDHECE